MEVDVATAREVKIGEGARPLRSVGTGKRGDERSAEDMRKDIVIGHGEDRVRSFTPQRRAR